MTKNTKIILAVSGVVLVGGFLFVAAAAIIGIGYLASQQQSEASGNKKVEKTERTNGDKILVAGAKPLKQSDVDGLIKFHEWAIESKFSESERVKFQSFVEADYRRDAEKTRRETDEMAETFKKIRAEDKDVQSVTRYLLTEAYKTDFRKKSDDYSRFMSSLYEKKGGVDSDDAQNVTVEKTAYTEGSMARELVGRWQRSEGSGYIDPTGKTQYKSGAYYNYEFAPDGTVEYSMESDVLSIMQCKMAESKTANGKATVSGETMTINFGEMNHTSSNSCEAADNFEKTLPAETVSLDWRLKTEYETTRLCIDEKDGEKCYDRKD